MHFHITQFSVNLYMHARTHALTQGYCKISHKYNTYIYANTLLIPLHNFSENF